jgi:hypothetical protein
MMAQCAAASGVSYSSSLQYVRTIVRFLLNMSLSTRHGHWTVLRWFATAPGGPMLPCSAVRLVRAS